MMGDGGRAPISQRCLEHIRVDAVVNRSAIQRAMLAQLHHIDRTGLLGSQVRGRAEHGDVVSQRDDRAGIQ